MNCIQVSVSFASTSSCFPVRKSLPPFSGAALNSLLLFLSAAFLILWFPTSSPDTLIQHKHDHHIQHHDPPHVNQTRNQTNNKNDDVLITPTKSHVAAPTCNQHVSVYVYTLPAKFNLGLLHNCHDLNFRTDMCPHVANSGLGQPLPTMGPTSAINNCSTSWFATNQFAAEMIFHARLLNHPCRTYDPARAALFYVPYYGGLHVSSKFREKNQTARDELDVALVDYLQSLPTWQKHKRKDHFMTLGRVARDFTSSWFGAGRLLKLAGVENMSVLIIERNPNGSNQHGIPYPSYFHPSTWREMSMWQTKMREAHRRHLFSFIGAKRRKAALRNELMKQCSESTRCMLLNCRGGNDEARKCQEPSEVLKVMSQSVFCLQAPGDSFTRRSTFDSVLAGCIPVFFSPHTAYSQYQWYLPDDRSEYSVYIDQRSKARKRIEEELLKIPKEKVKMMREKIIGLIPSLTYAYPNASDFGFQDAVDVALASLAKKVKRFVD